MANVVLRITQELCLGKPVIRIHFTFFMSFQCEVRTLWAELPHFDGVVQRGTRKLVVIFRVYYNLHHIMCVSFKDLWTIPFFLPIPQFYKHVVWKIKKCIIVSSSKKN